MFFRWHMIIIMISIRKPNIYMTLFGEKKGEKERERERKKHVNLN